MKNPKGHRQPCREPYEYRLPFWPTSRLSVITTALIYISVQESDNDSSGFLYKVAEDSQRIKFLIST